MKMLMGYTGKGVSPQLNGSTEGGSARSLGRFSIVNAWNADAGKSSWNGYKMGGTPFRLVNNAGDYLSRKNYTSGGSNQLYGSINKASTPSALTLGGGIFSKKDNTDIPSCTANVKYVYDGSDYTRFKKLQATKRSYNDYSFGGSNNSSQTVISRTRM